MATAIRGLAGRLRHGPTIPMRGGMNRGRVVTEFLIFFFEFDHPQFPIYNEVVKCFQSLTSHEVRLGLFRVVPPSFLCEFLFFARRLPPAFFQ